MRRYNTIRRRAKKEGGTRNASGYTDVLATIGMFTPEKTLQRAGAGVRGRDLGRLLAVRSALVALGAKQARKMTQIPSALAAPNQPSRDHEVVTQRLPEGDRPGRSRGIRTRHRETKLEGGHDGSGWVGGGR